MDEAKEEREAHRMAFDELNEALKPETTGPWKIEIEAKPSHKPRFNSNRSNLVVSRLKAHRAIPEHITLGGLRGVKQVFTARSRIS